MNRFKIMKDNFFLFSLRNTKNVYYEYQYLYSLGKISRQTYLTYVGIYDQCDNYPNIKDAFIIKTNTVIF